MGGCQSTAPSLMPDAVDASHRDGDIATGMWRGDKRGAPALPVRATNGRLPGDEVSLYFHGSATRGVCFVLDAWQDGGWTDAYYLVSDQGGGTRSWVSAGEGDAGCTDEAILGGGPDRVVIPDGAKAGTYRVCTDAEEPICTLVQVTSG